MTPTIEHHHDQPHNQLLQYTNTVNSMLQALHRIYANKKAISESLTRTAVALRRISMSDQQMRNTGNTE
jgi:hypothetical protein